MANQQTGRKRGGANRGYFYRAGRGWYATNGGSPKRLRDPEGHPLKDVKLAHGKLREALARFLSEQEAGARSPKTAGTSSTGPKAGVTLLDVCRAYLSHVEANNAEATYALRADTLFDLCFGLPARYRKVALQSGGQLTAAQKREAARCRIHDGFGKVLVEELLPLHIDQWLNAHPTWKGSRRSRIQAIKRALNYATEKGLIEANPIKGYSTPRAISRVTCLTPEQEAALAMRSRPEFATALRVCIRTGARPGVEFAALTSRHVAIRDGRMEWTFKPEESKTGIRRVLRIKDPEVIGLVERQLAEHRIGTVFRNSRGLPWNRESLAIAFRSAKARAERDGVAFDPDACMYSCRHTYAKRTLQGHWTGKHINIETLAALMGNSPQVCRDHYLQWSEIDNSRLWEAC